jgi:hypothetical protein
VCKGEELFLNFQIFFNIFKKKNFSKKISIFANYKFYKKIPIMIIIWIMLALLSGFILFAAIGHQLQLQAGKKASDLFKKLDNDYEDFINELITHKFASGNFDISKEDLREEVWTFIKPDIEGVFSHINATELSDVKIKYKSKYFDNLCRLAESFFELRKKTQNLLTETDRKRMLEVAKDSIEADLSKKMLRLKSGLL